MRSKTPAKADAKGELKKKPPIALRTVPTDDFTRIRDGETYYPHAGEWVTFAPLAMSTGEMRAAFGMDDYRAGRTDDMRIVDRSLVMLHKSLARRVVAWNWTDDLGRPIVPWNATDEQGNPYAKLDGSLEPFEALEADELVYLRARVSGEGPADRKNGSGE